jgi:transcriptional regulator with XRE-family HTH domain
MSGPTSTSATRSSSRSAKAPQRLVTITSSGVSALPAPSGQRRHFLRLVTCGARGAFWLCVARSGRATQRRWGSPTRPPFEGEPTLSTGGGFVHRAGEGIVATGPWAQPGWMVDPAGDELIGDVVAEGATVGWDAWPDPLFSTPTLPLPAMIRALRHFADLSQRELAARAGISKSLLADIETGDVASPSYPTILRLVEVAGLRLVVADQLALPLVARAFDDVVDAGGRRWPAHLDVVAVRKDSDWWYSRTNPGERPRPLYTAQWRRARGRVRVRRTKAQIAEQARLQPRACNTPQAPEVTDADPADG